MDWMDIFMEVCAGVLVTKYCIVVLICVSLLISDGEDLFTYLLAIFGMICLFAIELYDTSSLSDT